MENRLRVVSGRFRGQKLVAPGSGTHPMGSREKLALFNMVDVTGKNVLDAFAGSGALGIEALSHGAESVTFVEKSPTAMRVIRENVTGILAKNREKSPETTFFRQNVASFAKNPEFRGMFDIILADPPYDQIDFSEVEEMVPLLKKDGIMVLSSPFEQDPPVLAGLKVVTSRTYARARLSVYTMVH